MKILITGNIGYVGSVLVEYLRVKYPNYYLCGFDTGFFSTCLKELNLLPENMLNEQIYGDIRASKFEFISNFDSIVHLAGISNDPIGNFHESITEDINTLATKKLIDKCLSSNIKSFVFASSCSIYGNTGDNIKHEESPLDPLTAYARSKVDIENYIKSKKIYEIFFTNLRFATACGDSPRLRLDLVLNDFVASAVLNKKIELLSDGQAMRPLIDVFDMCRAIDWSIHRFNLYSKETTLDLNVGSKSNNFKISDLANFVKNQLEDCEIVYRQKNNKDSRSYEVDFSKFETIAKDYNPVIDIEKSISNLYHAIHSMYFKNKDFRNSHYVRLFKIKNLIQNKKIDNNFNWII